MKKKKLKIKDFLAGINIGLSIIFVFTLGYYTYPLYNYQEPVQVVSIISSLYPDIPEIYFQGIQSIIIDNGKGLDARIYEMRSRTEYSADYSFPHKEIRIFAKDNFYLKENLLHELGHNFFETRLSEEKRIKWERIFKKSENFVSSYARTDEEEDFAETFLEIQDNKKYYLRCYFGYYEDLEGYCDIDEDKLKFIIENVILIYEPEEFEDIKESILLEI